MSVSSPTARLHASRSLWSRRLASSSERFPRLSKAIRPCWKNHGSSAPCETTEAAASGEAALLTVGTDVRDVHGHVTVRVDLHHGRFEQLHVVGRAGADQAE